MRRARAKQTSEIAKAILANEVEHRKAKTARLKELRGKERRRKLRPSPGPQENKGAAACF